MTTYYVAKTGSDSNPGTIGSPKLTIAGGLSLVSISGGAGAGHTVEVAAGTYVEGFYGTFRSGTSFSSPFTLRAKSGDTVIIRPSAPAGYGAININGGQYWIIEGFVIDGALTNESVVTIETSHVRLLNNEIKNVRINNGCFFATSASDAQLVGGSIHDGTFLAPSGNGKGYAVYCTGNGNLIDGVHVYNIQGYGVHIYDSNLTPSNNTIRNCNIHDAVLDTTLNYQSGILLARGSNNVCYNNLIWSCGGHGIQVGFGASNSKMYNNTIYDNRESGINIKSNSSASTAKNNIIYLNGSQPIINEGSAANLNATNNLMNNNPFFVNAGAGDFHLTSASTLAIDAGVVIN